MTGRWWLSALAIAVGLDGLLTVALLLACGR
jgi:hypothetical protein